MIGIRERDDGRHRSAPEQLPASVKTSLVIILIELGGAATLKIESSRRIAFVATFESETEATTGSFTIGSGFLYIDGDEGQESMTLSCSLSGDTMTVANTAQTYDLDGDGIEEGARITMVLERPGRRGLGARSVLMRSGGRHHGSHVDERVLRLR